MSQNKNQKISTSLKKYHHKKRTRLQRNKELKIIIWILLAIGLIGFYTQHRVISPVEAQAPYGKIWQTYPIAEDKTNLSVKERIILVAQKNNFKYTDYLLRLTTCENRQHIVDLQANAGNHPSYSIDRGLYGINSYWQKGVSDECAYNVECSTKWTMDKINEGSQKIWMCDKLVRNNPIKYEFN